MIYMISIGTFRIGQLTITPGARDQLSPDDIVTAVQRHANCDWGDLCKEDKKQNDLALKNGGRLFSAYHSTDGTKFWIITEADRSATTILLPEEY
ncbi:MAG: hypothetical protein ACI4DT_00665 [Chordicoccus sp.]